MHRIGAVQRHILDTLRTKGTCTYSDLQRSGHTQQSLSRAALRLESMKLIKRSYTLIDYGLDSLNPYRIAVLSLV